MKPSCAFGVFAALALGGCAPGGQADANGEELVPINRTEVKPVELDKNATSLAIVAAEGRLQVGDPVAKAELVFPKPDKQLTEFRDLPPGFGSAFRSRGWETDAQGIGIISAEGMIVTAVHTSKGLEEDQVQSILRKYSGTVSVERPDVDTELARYWFAEDRGRRLMICAIQRRDGTFDVIEAIGESSAMNALRMNRLAAENDVQRAERVGASSTKGN